MTRSLRFFQQPKRWASQEVNPIIYRLQYNNYADPKSAFGENNPLVQRSHFDRYPMRSWSHQVYTPSTPTFFSSLASLSVAPSVATAASSTFLSTSSSTSAKDGRPLVPFRHRNDFHASLTHTSPYNTQFIRLKRYLEGYFDQKALIAHPLVMRTVAGCFVRLFIYNPSHHNFDYAAMEKAMESIFGQFQSAGTSGRVNGMDAHV
jgi:hypothetical protein